MPEQPATRISDWEALNVKTSSKGEIWKDGAAKNPHRGHSLSIIIATPNLTVVSLTSLQKSTRDNAANMLKCRLPQPLLRPRHRSPRLKLLLQPLWRAMVATEVSTLPPPSSTSLPYTPLKNNAPRRRCRNSTMVQSHGSRGGGPRRPSDTSNKVNSVRKHRCRLSKPKDETWSSP